MRSRPQLELARRLRALRSEWPDERVTQGMIAEALGGTPQLVSGWESATAPSTPPASRLLAYATLFATRRSLQGGKLRLLPDGDLDPDELATRNTLHQELLELREAALAEQSPASPLPATPVPSRSAETHSTWHFPDGAPVRLVCGKLDSALAGAYADPTNLNFTELQAFADIDALVELFGHVRKVNPHSDVRFLLAEQLQPDDLTAHVVLIGGLIWNPAIRWFSRLTELPIGQVKDPAVDDGEVFEVEREGRRRRFMPTFVENDPKRGLIEDVGLLLRMENPNNRGRTLTLCNGVFSRGVLGAVRCLTDDRLRERNEAYLAERFGDAAEFGLLLRVPVLLGKSVTPDLSNDAARYYSWPEQTP